MVAAAAQLGLTPRLRAVTTDMVTMKAARPKYCALSNDKLRAAVIEQDWIVAQRVGHSLKGTGPTMGFTALGQQGREIEEAAREHSRDRMAYAIERLAEYIESVQVLPA